MTGFVRGMAAAVAMAALVAVTSYTTVRCHYQPPGTVCATYAGTVERLTFDRAPGARYGVWRDGRNIVGYSADEDDSSPIYDQAACVAEEG